MRAKTAGVATIRSSAISRLFLDSPAFVDCQIEFEDSTFFDLARIVFGVTPESVFDDGPVTLRSSIFNTICERFIGITTNDIALAFATYEPPEKVYVLSRKDFIDPIEIYWNKKMIIVREINSEIEKLDYQAKSFQEAESFKNGAMNLYLECLNRGDRKWTGNEFQASAIYKNFDLALKDVDKEKWMVKAEEEHASRTMDYNRDPSNFKLHPPMVEMIYARIVIENCLKKKKMLIKD